MKYVKWEYLGLCLPMMEDDDGVLWCKSSTLCNALGTDEDTLRSIQAEYKEDFEESPIPKIHEGSRLWAVYDVIAFFSHARTRPAIAFRNKAIVAMKAVRKLAQSFP